MFNRVFEWLGIEPTIDAAEQTAQERREARAMARDLEIPEPADFSIDDDEDLMIDVDDPPRELSAYDYIPAPSFDDEPAAEIVASYDRGELQPWRVDATGRTWYRRRV